MPLLTQIFLLLLIFNVCFFPTELRIGFLETDFSVQETVPMVNLVVGIIEGDPEPGLVITVALTVSDGSAIGELKHKSV